jgi:site-specific recombinase XerD
MYEMHMLVHVVPFFGRLEQMTALGCADYVRKRLGDVSARTVRKELSTIRQFLAWCHETGVMPELVTLPRLRKTATGTPKQTQRRIFMTDDQVEKLIAAIPEKARLDFPARAFVLVMTETGLRRATMWKLRAPTHYHRGATHLTITPEILKTKHDWVLPLTARARKALDAVCPDEGLIFGRRGVRGLLESASRGIGLPPHLAGRVSYHDLRRSFITNELARGTPLAAVQYLAIHKNPSTTDKYVTPSLAAAEEAIRNRDADTGTRRGTRVKRRATKKKSTKRGKP